MTGRGARSVGLVFDFVSAGSLRSARGSLTALKYPPKFRGPDGRILARNQNHAVRHQIMRYATKCNLYLGAAGAALWAAVFLLPAYPRTMPLSAFEAVADAEKAPPTERPDELPPLRRKQGNHSGADRERESDCLAVNLLSRAQGEALAARITIASGHPEWIGGASEILHAPL